MPNISLSSFSNVHTILAPPLLVRSAKLSRIGPSQVRKWETIAKRKVVFLFAAAPPFAAPQSSLFPTATSPTANVPAKLVGGSSFFFPVRFFSRTDLGDFFAPFQPVSAHHPQTQPPVKSAGLRWWSAFTHTGRQAGRQGRSAGRQRILFLFLFLFPFSLSALAYNSVGPVIHTQRSTPSSSSRIA